MDSKEQETLIDLGRRLGKLEAENERLREQLGQGVKVTPAVSVQSKAELPKESVPEPTSMESTVLNLLVDKHPADLNAHMVSLELGISKPLALETLEKLVKLRLAKQVSIGRFQSINSRRKLDRASVMPRDNGKTPDVEFFGNSIPSQIYSLVIKGDPNAIYNTHDLNGKFPGATPSNISQACGNLIRKGVLRKVYRGGFYALASGDMPVQVSKVRDTCELVDNPIGQVVYRVLNQSGDRELTPEDILHGISSPVPPFNKLTIDQVKKSCDWLVWLRKVVRPEPGKYAKRTVKR